MIRPAMGDRSMKFDNLCKFSKNNQSATRTATVGVMAKFSQIESRFWLHRFRK